MFDKSEEAVNDLDVWPYNFSGKLKTFINKLLFKKNSVQGLKVGYLQGEGYSSFIIIIII